MSDEKNPFYGVEDVASMTECTGLMPALPLDNQQSANYAALYAIHKGKKTKKKKKK